MVKICSYNYPKSNEDEYKEYYKDYSYELHDFQKWCVEGIVTGNHVLACCPTGSGKTFGGEFAINYFHSKGKKVIYTSPIKALSNEKFHAFTQKYQHISIGILTGDLKCNPDADVLIMTTEILLNKLYQIKSNNPTNSLASFDMDIQNELGCVVFDEIHMINDENRGGVWEQTIMMLPQHIQMVGLSATLDNPEKFAQWLETKGDLINVVEKEVYLTRKLIRAVPLIHYSFITVTNTINKVIRDKATQEEIKSLTNKPFVIQDEKNVFNELNFKNMTRMLTLFEKHDVRVKRQFVLNEVAKHLVEKEMLPALCYVFSRKQLEKCAEEMTTNLLEFDSKVPYIVDRECEQIIRKLPNYQEYLHLPEYVNTVKLLRKGVGMHHAGMLPILREMTELLFARGFIKILFCTETMSVGINLPVRTTIFTTINKFNGSILRTLYAHEYVQAAGRSGRLGLDTVGHVIHLNNLFRNVESTNYKKMMDGKPQILTSKFKISYNLLLNLIDIGDNNLIDFTKRSMISSDVENESKELFKKIFTLQNELKDIESCVNLLRTPVETINEFSELQTNVKNAVNKKRKEMERKIQSIKDNYRFIEQDVTTYTKISQKKAEIATANLEYDLSKGYFKKGVGNVLHLLIGEGFIESDVPLVSGEITDNKALKLTQLGKIASQIREIHCLAFAKLYDSKALHALSPKQLVALFSCFTNVRAVDEFKDNVPKCDDQMVNDFVNKVAHLYEEYYDAEMYRNINTGFDYDIQYDLLTFTEDWCDAESVEDCKLVLQNLEAKKGIFLGEFVKALLKINNISSEFEKIAEMTGNIEFLSKLKEIPHMTLKYVVTNQSLYV